MPYAGQSETGNILCASFHRTVLSLNKHRKSCVARKPELSRHHGSGFRDQIPSSTAQPLGYGNGRLQIRMITSESPTVAQLNGTISGGFVAKMLGQGHRDFHFRAQALVRERQSEESQAAVFLPCDVDCFLPADLQTSTPALGGSSSAAYRWLEGPDRCSVGLPPVAPCGTARKNTAGRRNQNRLWHHVFGNLPQHLRLIALAPRRARGWAARRE